MSTNLGTARGRIVIDTGSIPGSLRRAEASVLGFSKATAGLAVGLTAGYGLVRGITDTIGAAATFEQRLSGLRAVSNATGAEMRKLTDQALALGQSTAFSASEVADAQTELVKAGASVDDVLGGALDSVLALAAAGEIELAPAARVVANAMNAFGLEAKDATRVADILASTANTTATDVGQLEQAFAQGGSAAAASGLPIEDFTAALGALAEGGVVGSDAGTSLKAALLSLVAPVGAGAKEIKKYGLEFFDAGGKIKGIAEISEELRAKLARLNPQQRAAALQAIAGRDGFRALLAVYKLGPKVLEDNIRASQRQGQAAEVAATKQDNLRGDVEKLGGAIETLQIRAGGGLQSALRSLTQGTTGLVESAAESEDLAQFGQALLDMGAGAGAALATLAPVAGMIVSVGGAAAQATGSVGSLVGSFAGTEAGALSLQFALAGLVGAYGSVKVATLAGAVARSGPAAFLSLATSVRTASDAAGLAGATFPRTAQALAGLRGVAAPAGAAIAGLGGAATTGASTFATLAASAGTVAIPVAAAALGVGLLAGGVAVLSSGVFAGVSHLEAMAAGFQRIATSSQTARASLATFTAATGQLKDANLAERGSLLALGEANRQLKALRDSGTASAYQLAQAELQVDNARRQHNRNRQATAQAEAAAGDAALKTVVDLGRLTTEIRRNGATGAEAEAIVKRYAGSLGLPARASGELARKLAEQEKAGAKLPQLYSTIQSALKDYSAQIDTSTKKGQEQKRVIDEISKLNPSSLPKFAEVYQKAIGEGVTQAQALKRALAEAAKVPKPVSVVVKTDQAVKNVATVEDALLSLKPKIVPVDVEDNTASAIAGIQANLSSLQDRTVRVNIVPVHKKGSWTVQETLEELDRIGRGKTVDVTFKPHGTGDVERTLVGMREGLGRQLARIAAAEEARQERNERRRLTAARDAAARELAGAKTADDRRSAQRSLNDAKAALAEFRIVAGVEARRAAIEVKTGFLDGVDSARSSLSSAMSNLGGIIGDALQRGLDKKLKGIDDSLKGVLETIDADLESTLERIDTAFKKSVGEIDAQINAIESTRSARDTARQRGTLTDAVGTADELVARRSASLARARTESERQAAQKLLDSAMREQQTAAEALSDFENDQILNGLRARRTEIEQQADAARTKAQELAEQNRTYHQAQAEAARVAAQTEFETQSALTQRLLGDLEERFRRGEISAKKFQTLLAQGLSDPKTVAALQASGTELGLAFSRGLKRAQGEVEVAARAIAAIPARYLRLNSPAETGPLAFDFTRSGRTIANDMAAGLVRGAPAVEQASASLAAAAAFRSTMGALAGQSGGATVAGDTHQTIIIPAERPVEDPRSVAQRLGWELAFGGGR